MVFTQGSDGEKSHRRKEVEYSRTPPGAGPGVMQGDPLLWRFEPTHVMDVWFDSDIMMLQLDWTIYMYIDDIMWWYDVIW